MRSNSRTLAEKGDAIGGLAVLSTIADVPSLEGSCSLT